MNNKFKSYLLIGGFIVVVAGLFLISEPQGEEIIIEQTNVANEEQQEVPKICVYVIGAVNEPGIIVASGDARLYEILELAGGITVEADVQKINLASVVKDEQKIIIPYIESRRL
jgi:competence protein ComEA